MKRKLPFSKSVVRIFIGIFVVCILSNAQIRAQPDTLFPVGIIEPFDGEVVEPLSFPLQSGNPIGDINGDGVVDFSFERYTWNEQTPDLTDKTYKSAIVTDISNPKSAFVITGAQIDGIGDYNGDGFDDMVDLYNQRVFLGNATGADFDTLSVSLTENAKKVRFYGDLDGDGKSDFIFNNPNDYKDSLMVSSINYSSPKKINISFLYGVDDELFFSVYDYDLDGDNELLIIGYEWHRYEYGWFVYDSVTDRYEYEKAKFRDCIHDPYHAFASTLTDLNGDGYLDICHAYFEEGFNIEAYFGNGQPPYYFDNAVEIEVHNSDRYFYCAGDFNGDGASDWYSKSHPDSMIVYYGHPDVAEQGFVKSTYYMGDNILMVTKPRFPGHYDLSQQPEMFDYDGDQIADIMLDYWTFNELNEYDTIGTAIITGSPEPDFTSPLKIGLNKSSNYDDLRYGEKVKNIGDFNRDGYDDWAVLATRGCFINIYYGGAPLDYEPDKTIWLPQYPFTQSFDMAFGDLNADGWVDLAVSNSSVSDVRYTSTLMEDKEKVYVFFGGATMPDVLHAEDASYVLEGTDVFYSFGYGLSIPGDFNADGFNDLIVAGGLHKQGSREAYIYWGGEQLSETPDVTIKGWGSYFGSLFGSPITNCGDINNDGFIDFTLGDRHNGPGKSLVYFGGSDADSYYDEVLVNPVETGRQFGMATPKTEGDFNHDGFPDLVQWNYYSSTINVFFGGPEFDSISDIVLTDSSLSVFMSCVEFVNDFSEKGKADLFISDYTTNGELLVFYGSDESKHGADLVLANESLHARGLASGDFNNNGVVDVFTGNSYSPVNGWAPGGVVQHYVSPTVVGTVDKLSESITEFSVIPNPAHAQIKILCKTNKTEDFDISVVNINGKEVLRSKGQTNSSTPISIESLPNGMYFVTITSSSFSKSKKVLKVGM